MNIELIRLKKKLAVMETEASNQVFVDLLLESNNKVSIIDCSYYITTIKNDYKRQIEELESKELKYKQTTML